MRWHIRVKVGEIRSILENNALGFQSWYYVSSWASPDWMSTTRVLSSCVGNTILSDANCALRLRTLLVQSNHGDCNSAIKRSIIAFVRLYSGACLPTFSLERMRSRIANRSGSCPCCCLKAAFVRSQALDSPISSASTSVRRCNTVSCTRAVSWDTYRWRVEEYHKLLKSGCQVEQYRLAAQGMKALLGFLSVIAVELLQLTYLHLDKSVHHTALSLVILAWLYPFPREFSIYWVSVA